MSSQTIPSITLNNGVTMPQFGLGVFKVQDGNEVINAVNHALKSGYRLIDTAALYGNERGVGQAVIESGIPREEIFVTTKLWNDSHDYDKALAAFDTSMATTRNACVLLSSRYPDRVMEPTDARRRTAAR
jgi:diketogulonate reductase-like aldo/keto reductase